MEEINFVQILQILVKRIFIIILVCVVVTSITGLYYYVFADDVYQATSTIIVSGQAAGSSQEQLTVNEYTLNVRLVESYSVISKTNRVLDQVKQELNLNMTREELASKITVHSARNTEIIHISVKDTNPHMAMNISNVVTKVFQREVTELMKMDNVQIIDEAPLPTRPVEPHRTRNVALGFLAGLMLGVALAFLVEYLDRSVKSSEQVEEILGVPVLASVPRILKD